MTVNDVYREIADVLLEPLPTGLSLGLITTAQFLDMWGTVFTDFLQQTGVIRKLIDLPIASGTSQYPEPDLVFDVQDAACNERLLHREPAFNLDQLVFNWRTASGSPRTWHEDRLAVRTIELNPTPNTAGYTITMTAQLRGTISATSAALDFGISMASALYGTIGSFSGPIFLEVTGNLLGTISNLVSSTANLTLLAGVQLAKKAWQLTDLVELIPDSFTVYLKYGILAKIFSMDGEQRDVLRARYCAARYLEGVRIGKAIMEEILEEGPQEA